MGWVSFKESPIAILHIQSYQSQLELSNHFTSKSKPLTIVIGKSSQEGVNFFNITRRGLQSHNLGFMVHPIGNRRKVILEFPTIPYPQLPTRIRERDLGGELSIQIFSYGLQIL